MYGCLESFETVTVYCNRGNHGKHNAAKWSSSKTTNWDQVFYHALEAAVRNDRIEFHLPGLDWKAMFRIQGHGFLAAHGDAIKRYYSLPWYGMTRQAMRWQNAYQSKIKLRYFMFGHNHNSALLRFNNVVIICNGSFITDDPYAEENLGVASVPEQSIMGVHPKHGVSWHYILNLK